ncbi:hypothetical protein KY359_00920 [Candidatus Woesearchaeota archaeon]|nr:hypothetical protein [Candidatus Woesearchaeota archaeon]
MIRAEGKQSREGKGNNIATKIAVLLIIALAVALLLSEVVSAQTVGERLRGAGGRIGGFFDGYASSEGPTFIDFFIFAVIFFALCWISFSQLFKEGKNANVVLSLALAVALSLALVYGGKFTIKKLLPFAMVILFLLLVIGIYAMLKKFVFTKDTIFSKIISFVIAIVVAIALLVAFWHFVCSDDNCENNAFMRKLIGSESIFARLFGGLGDLTTGEGPPRPGAGPSGEAIPQCGNGRVDQNETCDYLDNDETLAIGCPTAGMICWGACSECREPSIDQRVTGFMGRNWKWLVPLVIIVLFLLGGGIAAVVKRKKLAERWKNWRAKRKKKKELSALNRLLLKLEEDERSLAHNMGQLIENVKQEKEPFGTHRHIVDNITKELKQTIGEQIELIEEGKKEGLVNAVRRLHSLNNHERTLVTAQILPTIQRELHTIADEFAGKAELLGRINELEAVEEHFAETSKILDSFKRFNFAERNVIDNMIRDLELNLEQFSKFGGMCSDMLRVIDSEMDQIDTIEEGKIRYDEIVGKIRTIRSNAIRLNGLFSQKITQLRHIVQKMEEIKHHVHELHQAEINNLKQFLRKAEEVYNQADSSTSLHGYDTAMYLATHVAENAQFLKHSEMDETAREELNNMQNTAKEIIKDCIEKVFVTAVPKIEQELIRGRYAQVRRTLEQIGKVEFIDKEFQAELELPPIKEYEEKMKLLKDICDGMERGEIVLADAQRMIRELVGTEEEEA